MQSENTITREYMIKIVTNVMQSCSYDMMIAIYLFSLALAE